ncbi:hypothetical protein D9Q98_008243 [Chlorella vulgaris]|uniref:SigF-like NTF2-like domain-containing protein n=1 Tax=Chlorella vulgaris TaxID=3077 RepID=A0A9D4TG83_CHLVU|nr:hypothetical protein D9Q98_008243 [Chlorella vulgaris]
MQNVEKELPGLIKALLQSPAHQQRELIEHHYTPDSRMTHALVMAANREEIVSIFQYWRMANRRLDVDVNEIVYDKAGNKVWVQLVQHVTGYQHYTVPPLFGFSLPMSALMYLEDGPQGTKLIKKQVDFHSFEGILYCTPLIGAFMQHCVRSAVSTCIIGSAQLGNKTWPPLERWLQRTLPGGRRQVEGLKAWAASVWWRQSPAPRGRKVPPPYNPLL